MNKKGFDISIESLPIILLAIVVGGTLGYGVYQFTKGSQHLIDDSACATSIATAARIQSATFKKAGANINCPLTPKILRGDDSEVKKEIAEELRKC